MINRCLLLLFLAGLAGCSRTPAGPAHLPAQVKSAPVAPGQIGSRMPTFTVKDLRGNEISSTQLRGKVVLVDFWATWCGPCRKEMPGYQKLLDEYGPRGFVVVGFKFDTMPDTEDPLLFARQIGVHYPLAVASDDIKGKFGGILGLPTTMLYDRQGILRDKVIGFDYTQHFEQDLKTLL